MEQTLAAQIENSNIIADITKSVTGLVPALLPVMAVFIGINLVPKLVRKFAK